MQARNYDGALSAYEEAGRLGSVAGRERAAKVSQEKTAQVRLRLNRVDRLLDTGDYDEALRLIDEAASFDSKSAEIERLRQRVVDAQSFERGFRRAPK
jgi:tetratricopeptide (TPR) repeat protein